MCEVVGVATPDFNARETVESDVVERVEPPVERYLALAGHAPILARTGADFYGPNEAVAIARDEEDWPNTYDVGQLGTIAERGTFTVGPFTVHVERANDPDADHPVTYVIDHDAGTFFHGEDPKPVDAFADVGDRHEIDLSMLAYGTGGMILAGTPAPRRGRSGTTTRANSSPPPTRLKRADCSRVTGTCRNG